MKRYFIIYEGTVQGVGFRWRLMQIARKNDLSGHVRNCENGKVECEVQGENVDIFLKESLLPDRFVKVRDHFVKQIPIKEKEKGFTVRFGNDT